MVGAPRRRQPRATAIVVWVLWAISVVSVAISIVTARPGGTGTSDLGAALLNGLATLMLASVGAVLVTRLPHHRIGWLLAAGGLTLALSGATSGLADYGLNAHPGRVPWAIWLAWIGQWTWAPEIAILFILLPLFYPTGHLLSSRWRAAVAMAGVVLLGGVGSAITPWIPNPYPDDNPLAVGGAAGNVIASFTNEGVTLFVLAGGAAAIASLVLRYRRSAAIERAQLRWFAVAAMITAAGGTVTILVHGPLGSSGPVGVLAVVDAVASVAIYVGLALLPVAIGIAILRYRLYEIDRLVSRTITYGVLTAILAGVFVGVILGVGGVLGQLTGSNTVAVAGSTLVVASLFAPLRARIQRIVDRRFNRARVDADRIVAAFAGRLRDEVDLTELGTEITSTVAGTVQPASVGLWLRR